MGQRGLAASVRSGARDGSSGVMLGWRRLGSPAPGERQTLSRRPREWPDPGSGRVRAARSGVQAAQRGLNAEASQTQRGLWCTEVAPQRGGFRMEFLNLWHVSES